MKKFRFFALMAAMSAMFGLTSCHDDFNLDAYFETEYDEYEVDEIIYFNNKSDRAESYWWEFGDGYYSDRENPEHSFSAPGTYEVWLTIENDDESDDFRKVFYIHPKTVKDQAPETQPETQPESQPETQPESQE